MLELPEQLKVHFEAGDFAIRETDSAFNGIWTDLAVEKTIIKDSNSESGVKGFASQEAAIVRWSLITRHQLGEYASAMKDRSGYMLSHNIGHAEVKPAAIQYDEDHTINVIQHIKNNLTNPFSVEQHPESQLINISTGLHASREVQTSIIFASSGIMGKRQMEKFISSCLSDGVTKNFYNPIPKSGLKTFEHMAEKASRNLEFVKTGLASELVFRRALTLAANRENVTMESILSLPVTSIPTALFNEDGSMRKCQKSDLMHEPVTKHYTISELYDSESVVYIRDAMAELHSIKVTQHTTFQKLAGGFCDTLFDCLKIADTVMDVWDQYDYPNTVKYAEREKRGNMTSKEYQVIGGRTVPTWQKFLSVSSNKTSLSNFIGEFIAEHGPEHVRIDKADKIVHVAGAFRDGSQSMTILSGRTYISADLRCHQEKANTRMLFHALMANTTFSEKGIQGKIILKTPDTDVVVLHVAVYYFPKMGNISHFWIETGRKGIATDNHRFIPIHEMCQVCSPSFIQILPAVHALKGCDSIPSFYRIGKKTVMNVINAYRSETFKELANYGNADLHSDLVASRALVATLYDPKSKYASSHHDMTALRVELSEKDVPLSHIPPSELCLVEQAKRARWKTCIWTPCHLSDAGTNDTPDNNGWKKTDNGNYNPLLFQGQTLAESLHLLFCTCTGKRICSKDCVCKKSGLSCCDTCSCSGEEDCHNVFTHKIINLICAHSSRMDIL